MNEYNDEPYMDFQTATTQINTRTHAHTLKPDKYMAKLETSNKYVMLQYDVVAELLIESIDLQGF